MAQSALTVTPPNPTPPTNMSFTGATPPNPPNYTKNTYIDYLPDTDSDTYPPPFFDDGTAGALNAYAAATSALASGSGATAGGTEGTYPGAASGTVPASSSSAHEEVGNVTTVTNPGNIAYSYPGPVTFNTSQSVSDGPALTAGTLTSPNALHASYLTGTVGLLLPTITSVSAGGTAGAGTTLLTVTGTNYNRATRVYVDDVLQTTNYTSATVVYVTNAPKKATAGNSAVKVDNGVGSAKSAATNWVFS